MRTFLAALVVLVLPFSARGATSFAPDVSGLWWNPDESGWGVNLIQQGNIIFATFFVYGDDGRPRWFTASDMRGPAAPGDGPMVFSGKLYESTGPSFKSAFDPNAVVRREVGSATFEYRSPADRGTLTYLVEGVQVTKQIRRQTWAFNDITGHFLVSRVLRGENCDPATPVIEPMGTMEVVRSGEQVHILTRPIPPYPTLSCGYSGTYSQEGRLGAITGGHTCGDMTSGNFVLTEIEVTSQGFAAKLSQTFAGCTRSGTFGGPRATLP